MCGLGRPLEWGDRMAQKRQGRRPDLGGLYLRSSWEANYARYLNLMVSRGDLWRWEYEPDEFEFPVRRGSRLYIPDFKIWPSAEAPTVYYYIEVKGFFDQVSRTKLRRMRLHYPAVVLFVVSRAELSEIRREYGAAMPGWEK